MRRDVILGVVAACSALALVTYVVSQETGNIARQVAPENVARDVSAQSGIRAPGLGVASPASASASSARNESVSARLAAELRAATDWRVFAYEAIKRPEEGGYFYAIHVANWCGMGAVAGQYAQSAITNAVAASGTVSAKQIELTTRLSRLCASFASDPNFYQDVQRRALDGRDPLFNARQEVKAVAKSYDSKQIEAAMHGLLATGDSLAVFDTPLMPLIMMRSSGADANSSMWFEGERYGLDDRVKSAKLSVALAAAACSSGAPCEQAIHMTLGCLGGQYCTDSLNDYLRHQFVAPDGLTNAEFEEGLRLGDRVLDAMRNKSAASFLKPQ